MVNYVLAATAHAQATAMMKELDAHRPGAAPRLAQGALAEIQTWPELTVRRIAETRPALGAASPVPTSPDRPLRSSSWTPPAVPDGTSLLCTSWVITCSRTAST